MKARQNHKANIKALIDYINKIVPLNEVDIERISKRVTFRKYLKNQYTVQSGDVCTHESFIVSGSMKSFYVDEEGNEHVVMLAVENWWTGDLSSFVNQKAADFNTQCLENCDVIQISYDDLNKLYEEVPKMERMFRIIMQNAYSATQRRLISNFTLSAKERYLNFCEQYPEMEQRFPQYLIASYLGMTKEFLSKIRNQASSS